MSCVLIDEDQAFLVFHKNIELAEYAENFEFVGGFSDGSLELRKGRRSAKVGGGESGDRGTADRRRLRVGLE